MNRYRIDNYSPLTLLLAAVAFIACLALLGGGIQKRMDVTLATNTISAPSSRLGAVPPLESFDDQVEKIPIAEARRALAGFQARLEYAQSLRELARFPDDEELLKVWDLPETERERALQVRRERIEEAHRRMDEAQLEEAAACAELKALGITEP